MKYEDLDNSDGFFRNMRRTPWLKLFPHWWSEKDPLLNAIGDEVERIKASAIFGLLNAGIKPPVLLWQESLNHKVYNVNKDITQLPSTIEINAPRYKTWGNITLTNNTKKEIDGIEITFDGLNGYAINQLIAQGDIIVINLTENKVQINGHTIKPQKIGKGMPYFITSPNNLTYKQGTPLHNEIIRLKINTDTNLENTTVTNTINVTEKLDKWTVTGDAVRYNSEEADPWIQINNGAIQYNLDFTNISNISFWYKGQDSSLVCRTNGELIHQQHSENFKINDIVNGLYGTYNFDMGDIDFDQGIKITNTIIDAKPKVKLTKPNFDRSTYILHIPILRNNIITNTIKIELQANEWVDIPVEDFKNSTIGLNAEALIVHSIPEMHKNSTDTWSSCTLDTTNLISEGTIEFYNAGDNPIYINDIKYTEQSTYNMQCDINVDINLENAVFIDEQNIEVTGLELIPIEKIELYAKYDFPYNSQRNGWQKVYEKKYDVDTNVIYDMITTHFYTKEFYVDVWFKTLQYPYKVGFPCTQDADEASMFHVNNRLDTWGEQLGLQRRLYKKDIAEEDYYRTFPIFYPFDIEQDYWYYKRLANEYTWNDLAINNVDIKDTEGNDVFRLYSINPFCDDFVVHAKSSYPIDKEFVDYNKYHPVLIRQDRTEGYFAQSEYSRIVNLLGNNNYTSSITLNNRSDTNDIVYKEDRQHIGYDDNELGSHSRYDIRSHGHISKDLITYFDLTDLPENINIDDIIISVEGESTDNKTNKYNTERTGFIIPNLYGEDIFIPLTTDERYQLNKQSIEYSIAQSGNLSLLSDIAPQDENIIQKAIIGNFEGKINDYIRIPFQLTENDTIVDDINEVYLYFNDVLKTASIDTDEDGQTYIQALVPQQAITNKISIICKSETHMPYSTQIDVAQMNHYVEDDNGNQNVDYQYIAGPLVDNEPNTIEVKEEWHTNDIRNILQRQGIYLRYTLENNDEQSSTTIILHNIKLEVHYSQKKSDFKLDTYINVKDATKPNIGIYEVSITNTGDKPLKTSIDIITPPNIKMEKNYIDVDLNINGGLEEKIQIFPEYPIIDGFYDILTFCDNVVKKDSINVFSDGLTRTGVTIKPHNGKYNEDITLSAEVQAIDGSKIHGGVNQIQFYINGYAIGEPATVYNNKASITITPGHYSFTGTGTLPLEARYLGNIPYASSIGHSTIFIGKNSTHIKINAPDKAIYKGTYEANAIVEYFNGEQYYPVNDGYVTFYLQQANNKNAPIEILSSNAIANYSNGQFSTVIESLENLPGDYILTVRYEGSNIFASVEETKNFEIIGGEIKVLFFDMEVKPHDTISLKANVFDKGNKIVPYGYIDFYNEELNIDYKNIPIVNGIASTPSFLLDTNEEKDYSISVKYHGAINAEDDIYKDASTTGYITIKKEDVIIEHETTYQASQHEPIGMIIKVKDAKTNQYVSDGTVTVTLPQQNNLAFSADVDENGTARLIHNLINLSAKEWYELLKWSFSTANDNTLNQIDIINESTTYNPDDLYAIYDGDYNDKVLVDFELQNGDLIYVGNSETDKDVHEYVFISSDGHLYARTDDDTLREYQAGLQNIIIEYSSSQQYRPQRINVENGLNIEAQKVDLDIHSYDLTYTDTDNITCYVTKYDIDEVNIPITEGQVQFIFDDKVVDTVNVSNGKAILNNELLTNVAAGAHLLEVDYINNNQRTTRSFSLFNIRQSIPVIHSIEVDRITRNKNSQIIVSIQHEKLSNFVFDGMVSLYLINKANNTIEKIGEQYLYGNEEISGIIDYDATDIAEDENIRINDLPHILFNYVMPDDVDTPNKYALQAVYEGNEFFAPSAPMIKDICEEPSNVNITSQDVNIEDIIDIAVNEQCTIDFTISSSDDIISEGILYLIEGNQIKSSSHVVNNQATLTFTPDTIKEYSYELKYSDATHYNEASKIIKFNSIEAVANISYPNLRHKSIKHALMCLQSNGTITLVDNVDLIKSLKINKDCYIVGDNDVCIVNQSDEKIDIDILSSVHINNIHFVSDNSIMNINNNQYLVINHSILDKNINLHNNNTLMAQRNLIYGTCTGKSSDLNNNWWGSNTAPYDVENHIIIQVKPINSPAVITEHVDIVGEMIGNNGRKYDMPDVNFTFGADTGYFSIDSGKTVDSQIKTKYLDAEHEGNIYFTVDNETALCKVYDYERKTEVIIDDINDIPLSYQVPITAKVQSVADIYYEFENNKVTKSTTTINEGHISFLINDKQVGYVPVVNGEATVIVYFTPKYYTNNEYTIKAIYIPEDYYFASEDDMTFSLINDNNSCYVSALFGDNNNDGLYNTPVATIEHALSLNKQTIYLLDDTVNESNINIQSNTIIKSFKNHTAFNNISNTIFIIPQEVSLELDNIDFNNNDIVFDNQGILNLNQCILYKNKRVFSHTNQTNIRYSAIVDNDIISDDVDGSWFTYCWFGTNTPQIPNINDYVQMRTTMSKDVLYIGTLALVTGLLDTYKHGMLTYKLEEPLPLRIAKFATTYGSVKPIKDYTYNKQSTSVIDTQKPNNTQQYIISIPDNTNYVNKKVTLQCLVQNVYGENATGTIQMNISGPNINIDINSTLNNGIGKIITDKMNIGRYTLTCTYIDDNKQKYTSIKDFVVKKPDLVIKKFNIVNGDNLYSATLDIELEDTFGQPVNNELINVKIDDEYITTLTTDNGYIFKQISYNNKQAGQHTISIDNENTNSKYDDFVAYNTLNINQKDTQIIFNYNKFEAHIKNNINIQVIDNEGHNVNGGYLDIEIDNEKVFSDIEVINGNANINNFIIDDIGQHSISIYYSGLNGYYNESLFINNNIGVGIFNVKFGLQENEYINTDIGKPLNFSTQITDESGQLVNHGYVNIYINDILFNEKPLFVNNGVIDIQQDLPANIISGNYTFRLEYIDPTNIYLDTFLLTYLVINKIQTSINVDIIYGAPGQDIAINYQVSTIYGGVNSGTLIAKYNDEIIGRSNVTDSLNNQIIITVPFVPDTDDYIITFDYDDNNIYAHSSTESRLIIDKNQVNITPSHSWYYPNQTFHFVATITDDNDNRINIGKAALYIDNVKETESQDVINGQFTIPLSFNKAREYPMTIVYEGNEYYEETAYAFTFTIDSVDIDDLTLQDIPFESDNQLYYTIDKELYSLPNQTINTELVFKTLDNYNVKDGIVDIYIDNNKINSYYVTEDNKYIDFNINDISKGLHTLTLQYYGSSLFNDITKEIPLHVLSKQIMIKINDNASVIDVRNHSDIIDIYTVLYDVLSNQPTNTTGLLKYYIGLPVYKASVTDVDIDYNYRYIGAEQVNNNASSHYQYQLPSDLLEYAADKYETLYKIKVTFSGSDEYDDKEKEIDLQIHKQDCNITFDTTDEFIETNYKETLDIDFNIDAQGSPLVNIYFDNDLIGSTIAQNNKGHITYKMEGKYTVKEGSDYYTLRINFAGSAVDKPAEASIKVHVHPLMPRMNVSQFEAYYGGSINIDNILTDVDGAYVNDGTLTYTLADTENTFTLNTSGTIQVPPTIREDCTINVRYDTTNSNYATFNKDINLILKPNDIHISVQKPDTVYRGQEYNLILTATSDTTELPIDITINDNYDMQNGYLELPFIIPYEQPHEQLNNFAINFAGNQFFNPFNKEIQIQVHNYDEITIDTNQDTSATNAHTIEKALDLVAEYGTINIIKTEPDQEATITKGVTIQGDVELNNCKLINEANEVTIKNITFNNNESNAIINNGELLVSECTFNNGQNNLIYNNNNITIHECTFKNNNTQNEPCVYISNKNHNTIISNCVFKQNNASGNCSCIYSNKGNDVEISYNRFSDNNGKSGLTTSICIDGNSNISSNSFYNNGYEAEIYLLKGTLSADNNIFDGAIQSIKGYNGDIDADFNYWGYNNIEDIENNNSILISFNNWLLSHRFDYNKQINGEDTNITVGVIDRYANKFEKEIINIDPINQIFPVVINSNRFNLNDEIKLNASVPIKIGQQELKNDTTQSNQGD